MRRCILFDDLGYVVSYDIDDWMNGKRKRISHNGLIDAIEKYHISHLESQLTMHLILNSQFVEKKQCAQWPTRSIERFFQFNVSFSDALRVSFVFDFINKTFLQII